MEAVKLHFEKRNFKRDELPINFSGKDSIGLDSLHKDCMYSICN